MTPNGRTAAADGDDRIAAELVLGTLDGARRARALARLEDEPEWRRRVAEWERRLGGLAEAVSPIEPPPGLWASIERAVASRPAEILTVHAEDGTWRPIHDGVELKRLSVDRLAGTQSYLLRFAPGARLPAHEHRLGEECILLSGSAQVGRLMMRAGDYQLIPAGVPHEESASAEGCVVFVRAELRPRDLM
jgi:anti-sigma factor ChrR (cupin superfamily)